MISDIAYKDNIKQRERKMFALTYKAGWMQTFETFSMFETKEAAKAAVKEMVSALKAAKKGKIWAIKIEEV
jgi:hypothetical protein